MKQKIFIGNDSIHWDADMEDLLLRLYERNLSDRAISQAMSVVLGFEIRPHAIRHKRRIELGLVKPVRGTAIQVRLAACR